MFSNGGTKKSRFRFSIIIAILFCTVALQSAHVCPIEESSSAGIHAAISVVNPVCPVCALAHSVLITLLLILISLVPTRSRTVPVLVQARSYLQGIRLDLRAPPAF